MPYQPLIPTGNVNLDIDYQNIQGNFQALDTTFGVDHVTFSNATLQNGYHKAIHLVSGLNPPPTTPTTGQIYSASVNDSIATDTTLYYLTGLGNAIKLTRNFLPLGAANGYSFIAGGLMVQWGIVSFGVSPPSTLSGTVTFATANKAFPTSCFMVQLQLISITPAGTASSGNSLFVRSGSVSGTQFNWRYNGGSNDFSGFYWLAIGI